jgi:hypothetical protein
MTEPTILRPDTDLVPARRTLLVRGTQAVLSAGAIAILAGCESMASSKQASAASASNDVQVLNTALGLEYEGIAAYRVGAESGLLTQPVLGVAVKFQDHHKKHADLLASTVKKLGGSPVMPKARYDFPTGNLKTQEDVLRFAAGLEQGAAQAWRGAGLRQQGPLGCGGQHHGRRGDALGRAAQRSRRGPDPRTLRHLVISFLALTQ